MTNDEIKQLAIACGAKIRFEMPVGDIFAMNEGHLAAYTKAVELRIAKGIIKPKTQYLRGEQVPLTWREYALLLEERLKEKS